MALRVVSNIPDLNKASVRLRKQLPAIVANKAKNHYLEGFRRGGGMTNKSRGGWRDRKKDERKYGRGILVRKDIMRNDIDIRKTTFEEIVLGDQDTDYLTYHQTGTDNMVMREVLGKSKSLDNKVDRLIIKKMKQIYR